MSKVERGSLCGCCRTIATDEYDNSRRSELGIDENLCDPCYAFFKKYPVEQAERDKWLADKLKTIEIGRDGFSGRPYIKDTKRGNRKLARTIMEVIAELTHSEEEREK